MATYVLVYLGGTQPASEDEARQHMMKYSEWLNGLGDAVLSPTIPLKDTHTVGFDGSVREGGTSAMSVFTVISAVSMESAIEIAQACPFLEIGGTLEVSEMMQMPVQ